MLTEHQSGGKTVWVDLCNPTDEDIGQACTVYGLNIPPRAQLEEIEFSSRLQYEDGVFTISVPVTPHNKDGGEDVTSPLGFVLTKDMLVTIRFAQLHTFDAITAAGEAAAAQRARHLHGDHGSAWSITAPTGWKNCAPRR